MATELTVGDVARRSGLAVSALHFYERKGLIRANRSVGNQRRYGRDVLRRLALIRMGQELGLSLSVVADALSVIPHGQVPTRDDWTRLSARWQETLERRIVLLSRLKDELEGCIGCGCLSTAHCPIINQGDHMGAGGSGPRHLLRPGSGG